MLYRLALKLRHLAYDKGWLPSERVPICTVSIGGVAVGGSGKTPIVQKLAKELSATHKVAISLRGYLSEAEHLDDPILVTDQTPVVLCGDEAYIHATNIPEALVFAGKSRIRAGHMAATRGAKILILDDGMQHRKIQSDLTIAVIDAQDDLQTQKLLPFGRLRDLPERLSHVDAVILHNAHEGKYDVKAFTQAPCMTTRMEVSQETVEALRGKRIAYFCGIGRPQRFEQMLLSLETTIVAKYLLRDHATISSKQLFHLCSKAKREGADMIVCTQKDCVKLPKSQMFLELPLHVARAEATLIDGKEIWEGLIKSIILKSQEII